MIMYAIKNCGVGWMTSCGACGTSNTDNSKYCIYCGVFLNGEKETSDIPGVLFDGMKPTTMKPNETCDHSRTAHKQHGKAYCVDCGIDKFPVPTTTRSYKTGILEEDRLTTPQEMKELLWSIDWEKIPENKREFAIDGIRVMLHEWKNDPNYIPIITAPTKSNTGGLNNESLLSDEVKMKMDEVHNAKMLSDMGFEVDFNDDMHGELQVRKKREEDRNQLGTELFPSIGKKIFSNLPTETKLIEMTRSNTVVVPQCGYCGNENANLCFHPPSVQEQHQEAFENIQKFRRKRFERWEDEQLKIKLRGDLVKALNEPPMFKGYLSLPSDPKTLKIFEKEMKKWKNDPWYVPMLSSPDILDVKYIKIDDSPSGTAYNPPKSAVIERDVRKGISEKSPITRRDVWKGIGRKKPPKKIDPPKDHVISKVTPQRPEPKLTSVGGFSMPKFRASLADDTLIDIMGTKKFTMFLGGIVSLLLVALFV